MVDATGAIIVLDPSFKLKKVIKTFEWNGKTEKIKTPRGVVIGQDGYIYICDSGNPADTKDPVTEEDAGKGRIIKLDMNGKCYSVITTPGLDILKKAFLPHKIAVDRMGIMYVLSQDDNNGILQFDSTGKYMGYFGSNRVLLNLLDLIWRQFSTKEQIARMPKSIPVEYDNLKMDDSGFIFTTSAVSTTISPIRKLNSSGKDILVRKSGGPIDGDTTASFMKVKSNFIDICVEPTGIYNALDAKSGKIFTYGNYGHLLYEFGRIGTQVGCFLQPVAIEYKDDYIYVLDMQLKRITEFRMTDYAKLIKSAEYDYINGDYQGTLDTIDPLLKMNSNFNYAYVLAGNAMIRLKEYDKAMEYFMLGHYPGDATTGYSRAMKESRKIYMRANFGKYLTGFVIFVALFVLYKYLRKRKNKKDTTEWEGDSNE
jgi:tetratricopeptide (TPR) repeat protein